MKDSLNDEWCLTFLGCRSNFESENFLTVNIVPWPADRNRVVKNPAWGPQPSKIEGVTL